MNKKDESEDRKPGEKKKTAWIRPEISVLKIETPPAWSSCSSGSGGTRE